METRTIKQGPRGGRYYVNSSGNRTYVNRSTPVTDDGSLGVFFGIGLVAVLAPFFFIF